MASVESQYLCLDLLFFLIIVPDPEDSQHGVTIPRPLEKIIMNFLKWPCKYCYLGQGGLLRVCGAGETD